MTIEVTCIECGASHQVHDRLAGRRVRCPDCDTAVHVPADTIAEEMPIADETDAIATESIETEPLEAVPVAAVSAPVADPIPAPALTPQVSPLAETPDVSARTMPAEDDDDEDDDEVLPRGNRPEEEMDMTPMVDVTFLLLIFFMVTAAFSLQKSINMPRQQTDAPSMSVNEEESEDLDMVELEVDEFGSFLVMAPDWERETPGKQNLITALREALAGNKDGMRLVIKVHEMAKLRALVDAMDAGTIAGYAQLEVTQVDGFD